jgi:predicted nucleic acid-binding protein
MITYALDTNIVSYFLKGDPVIKARMRLEKDNENQFVIPPTVYSDDDLLIAAYCIKHNLPLVTNNTKHFTNIEHLKILNWIE